MARYKHIDTSPRFIPVDLKRQLLPGSFEYALAYLIDHQLDFAAFDGRYRNDDRGAAAYPPRTLLKIILFAYSRGIVSSRSIKRACREHVTFIALSTCACRGPCSVVVHRNSERRPVAGRHGTLFGCCLSSEDED
jgi:transposase